MVYIDPHELEYISVDLLVSVCQIVIYMLGDGEVEEDVKTAEGEVVEKAEEIDAEGNAGQQGGNEAGYICCEVKRCVYYLEADCLSVCMIDWRVEIFLIPWLNQRTRAI